MTSTLDCLACAPGKYCATTGLSAPTGNCDAGYYCTSGATRANPTDGANAFKCVAGFYCPEGSAYQIPCKPGSYCDSDFLGDVSGDCQEGYYCPEQSTSATQTNCPAGHYCDTGSSNPIPCPAGTYSSAVNNKNVNACLDCPSGSYCESTGLTTWTGACAEGYFCPDATIVQRPTANVCPVGYKCPSQSADKQLCTNGYQDQTMQGSCITCPAGYHCPDNGGVLDSKVACDSAGDAEESFYCPLNVLDKQTCGAGYYSNSMLSKTASDCELCPPGFYCENTDGEAKFKQCPAGNYCEAGSSTSAGSGTCTAGNYCPAGVSEMFPCTPGKYCDGVGLDDVSGDCAAGFYCLEGSDTN